MSNKMFEETCSQKGSNIHFGLVFGNMIQGLKNYYF
jgi:hypothetical protein